MKVNHTPCILSFPSESYRISPTNTLRNTNSTFINMSGVYLPLEQLARGRIFYICIIERYINSHLENQVKQHCCLFTWESERTNLIPLPGYILAPLKRQSSVLKRIQILTAIRIVPGKKFVLLSYTSHFGAFKDSLFSTI